jgi:hypothetical protein
MTASERDARGAGAGFRGIRERAWLLEGAIEVVSALGQGNVVRAEFPLEPSGRLAREVTSCRSACSSPTTTGCSAPG